MQKYDYRGIKSYLQDHRFYLLIIFIVISIGIIARFMLYMNNRSLWLDEAMLAINIVFLDFDELIKPLKYYQQAAPIGFLMITKIFVVWIGSGELVLRLVPFIAGVVSLPLYYFLAKRWLSTGAIIFAVIFLSFSYDAIYYSNEFKQYSLEMLSVIVILLLAVQFNYNRYNNKRDAILLGGVGVITVWFSHAVIIVLSGVGMTLMVLCILERNNLQKKEFIYIICIGSMWIVSFLANYMFVTRATADGNFFQYFAAGFAPFPPVSFNELLWYPRSILNILERPFGFSYILIYLVIGIAGVIAWWKEKKLFQLLTLIITVITLYVLSSAMLYPIVSPLGSRLLLFLLPIGYLLFAEGLFHIYKNLNRQHVIIGFLFISILIYPMMKKTVNYIKSQGYREETRPLVEYYVNNKNDNDIIYVYYKTNPAFKYYTRYMNVKYVEGGFSPDNPIGYFEELEQIPDNRTLWLIFSHEYMNPEEIMVEHLKESRDLILKLKEQGASLYKFSSKLPEN